MISPPQPCQFFLAAVSRRALSPDSRRSGAFPSPERASCSERTGSAAAEIPAMAGARHGPNHIIPRHGEVSGKKVENPQLAGGWELLGKEKRTKPRAGACSAGHGAGGGAKMSPRRGGTDESAAQWDEGMAGYGQLRSERRARFSYLRFLFFFRRFLRKLPEFHARRISAAVPGTSPTRSPSSAPSARSTLTSFAVKSVPSSKA